jgi:hypothetical protein
VGGEGCFADFVRWGEMMIKILLIGGDDKNRRKNSSFIYVKIVFL